MSDIPQNPAERYEYYKAQRRVPVAFGRIVTMYGPLQVREGKEWVLHAEGYEFRTHTRNTNLRDLATVLGYVIIDDDEPEDGG